jgi:lambda family phage portal protein
MPREMVLGGIVIPPGSDFQFSYVSAQTNRFRDYTNIPASPLTEAAMLPQWERNVIVSRLRHLVRNDPYVAAMVNTFAVHIGNSTLRSKTTEATFNDLVERVWLDWSDDCEVTGLSLPEVEEIIYLELLVAGELFFLKLTDGRVQIIPSEYVFSPADAPENEVQGIQYDGVGSATAYRIGYRDPKGQLRAGETTVPAAQVIHLFKKDRAEMGRGVPWLAAALPAIQDLAELVQAKVQAVKAQSFISAVVTSNNTSDMPTLADGFDSAGARSRYATLKNGTIIYLEPGEDIKTVQAAFQSTDFNEFVLSRLRAIGATIQMPLELFIEGFRDSNYSSARATNLIWGRKVKAIRRLVEHRVLEPLAAWVIERARAAKALKPPADYDGEFAFGWPTLPAIDEAKEAQANVMKLAAGLTTYTAIYAENNLFFDDEVKTRARDARLIIDAAKAEGVSPQFIVPDFTFLNPTPAPGQPTPQGDNPAPPLAA